MRVLHARQAAEVAAASAVWLAVVFSVSEAALRLAVHVLLSAARDVVAAEWAGLEAEWWRARWALWEFFWWFR